MLRHSRLPTSIQDPVSCQKGAPEPLHFLLRLHVVLLATQLHCLQLASSASELSLLLKVGAVVLKEGLHPLLGDMGPQANINHASRLHDVADARLVPYGILPPASDYK